MDRRFSNNERDGKVYTNKLRGISANSDYRMEELKKPKILSTIGSTNTKLCDQADDISDHYQDSDVRDIKSDTYKKPEAIQRNKRLFGALMGHLGVAKRKLEEDSTNIEKQSAFQMAVLQKNDLENRRLQQLQREASNSYKAKVYSPTTSDYLKFIVILCCLDVTVNSNFNLIRKRLSERYSSCDREGLRY